MRYVVRERFFHLGEDSEITDEAPPRETRCAGSWDFQRSARLSPTHAVVAEQSVPPPL